jgi:hypothetical protein
MRKRIRGMEKPHSNPAVFKKSILRKENQERNMGIIFK